MRLSLGLALALVACSGGGGGGDQINGAVNLILDRFENDGAVVDDLGTVEPGEAIQIWGFAGRFADGDSFSVYIPFSAELSIRAWLLDDTDLSPGSGQPFHEGRTVNICAFDLRDRTGFVGDATLPESKYRGPVSTQQGSPVAQLEASDQNPGLIFIVGSGTLILSLESDIDGPYIFRIEARARDHSGHSHSW